jgi:hypothetical protein
MADRKSAAHGRSPQGNADLASDASRPLACALDARQAVGSPAANKISSLGRELLADLLRCNYRVLVTARGNSMHPAIRDGEQLRIAPLGPTPLRRGDIVYVQRADQGHVLHRVVRILTDGRIQTRGDAHWRLDDAVCLQAVLGRAEDAACGSRTAWRRLASAFHFWRLLVQSWGGYRLAHCRECFAGRMRRYALSSRWTAGRRVFAASSSAAQSARQSGDGSYIGKVRLKARETGA